MVGVMRYVLNAKQREICCAAMDVNELFTLIVSGWMKTIFQMLGNNGFASTALIDW